MFSPKKKREQIIEMKIRNRQEKSWEGEIHINFEIRAHLFPFLFNTL